MNARKASQRKPLMHIPKICRTKSPSAVGQLIIIKYGLADFPLDVEHQSETRNALAVTPWKENAMNKKTANIRTSFVRKE